LMVGEQQCEEHADGALPVVAWGGRRDDRPRVRCERGSSRRESPGRDISPGTKLIKAWSSVVTIWYSLRTNCAVTSFPPVSSPSSPPPSNTSGGPPSMATAWETQTHSDVRRSVRHAPGDAPGCRPRQGHLECNTEHRARHPTERRRMSSHSTLPPCGRPQRPALPRNRARAPARGRSTSGAPAPSFGPHKPSRSSKKPEKLF
jgi:hypothetical protein